MVKKLVFKPACMVWEHLPFPGRALLIFWACALVGLSLLFATSPHIPTHRNNLITTIKHQPSLLSQIPHKEIIKPPSSPTLAEIQKSNKTPLAIVLEGFGFSEALSQDVLSEVPTPVAVNVSPYIDNIHDVIAQAQAANREIYITLPLQNSSPEYDNKQPHMLGYGNTPKDDLHELAWCLSQARGASGLTDAYGTKDEQSRGGYATTPDFLPIAKIIEEHKLLYLSSSPNTISHIKGMTVSQWMDGDTDPATLDQDFSQLSSLSTPTPYKLLMISPLTPLALEKLKIWLNSPEAKKFTLVPPSTLAEIK
ncbi:divergent polysaccharide deacetylase family protein [Swingsia samuiensis]|nr:divergent polysaccharide deacetylase family protein [Swingsia samuiensis]